MSDRTPDQIVAEIRRLVVELSTMTGALTPDTKEPLIPGNGLFDVREFNGVVQISLGTDIGWVQTKADLVFSMNLAGQIQAAVIKAITSAIPKPELIGDPPSIH